MQDTLHILAQMQVYDDKIGEKEELKVLLPKQLNELTDRVENARKTVDSIKQAQEEKIRQQKQKELEIKSNTDLMRKYQTQLAEIKSNKEYKALNSEVTSLGTKNSEIETQILTIMDEETALRAQLADAQNEQKQAESELQAREGELRNQMEEVDKMIANYKEERNKLGRTLPPAIAKRYVLLIKNKNRKAVVESNNGTCSGCGFKIRPQLMLELEKRNHVVACENCGRMMVASLMELLEK